MKHDVTGRAGSPASTLPAAGTPAGGGWHWAPWACEFLGTAILLGGGLSAVFVDFGPSSPVARQVPSMSARLLLTGLLFAGTGSLVAPSRWAGAAEHTSTRLSRWPSGLSVKSTPTTSSAICDAGVAQIPFTAFASRGRAPQVTARLIVRRVRDANPEHVHAQGELFRIWRHHAIFTDLPLPMLTAEADHRRHAIPSSPSRAARSRNGSRTAPGDGYS